MAKSHPVLLIALGGALALSVPQRAAATPVTDQSDTVANGAALVASSLGQSFTAGVTGALTSFFIASPTAALTLGSTTVSLYRGDGLSSGSLLGTTSVTPGKTLSGYTFDVSSLAANLVAGQQYTFNVSAGFAQSLYALTDSTGTYVGGKSYISNAAMPSSDLTFNTMVNPQSQTSVPEPASLIVLCTGLAGLVLLRRQLA